MVLLVLLDLLDRFTDMLVEVVQSACHLSSPVLLQPLPTSVLQEEIVDVAYVALVTFSHRCTTTTTATTQIMIVSSAFSGRLLTHRARLHHLRCHVDDLGCVRNVHVVHRPPIDICWSICLARDHSSFHILSLHPFAGFTRELRWRWLSDLVPAELHRGRQWLGVCTDRRGVVRSLRASAIVSHRLVALLVAYGGHTGRFAFKHFQQRFTQLADPFSGRRRRHHHRFMFHIRVPLAQHHLLLWPAGLPAVLFHFARRRGGWWSRGRRVTIRRSKVIGLFGFVLRQIEGNVFVKVLEDVEETLAHCDRWWWRSAVLLLITVTGQCVMGCVRFDE
uniref:Putative secreted protein n=1 Tax=Anopheles marajoara TaxID=58244 RepID=A0A2M4C5P2_9DIPT